MGESWPKTAQMAEEERGGRVANKGKRRGGEKRRRDTSGRLPGGGEDKMLPNCTGEWANMFWGTKLTDKDHF